MMYAGTENYLLFPFFLSPPVNHPAILLQHLSGVLRPRPCYLARLSRQLHHFLNRTQMNYRNVRNVYFVIFCILGFSDFDLLWCLSSLLGAGSGKRTRKLLGAHQERFEHRYEGEHDWLFVLQAKLQTNLCFLSNNQNNGLHQMHQFHHLCRFVNSSHYVALWDKNLAPKIALLSFTHSVTEDSKIPKMPVINPFQAHFHPQTQRKLSCVDCQSPTPTSQNSPFL